MVYHKNFAGDVAVLAYCRSIAGQLGHLAYVHLSIIRNLLTLSDSRSYYDSLSGMTRPIRFASYKKPTRNPF